MADVDVSPERRRFSTVARFALEGVVLGALLPLATTLVYTANDGRPFSFDAVWQAHVGEPLLWVIDSVPVLLGLLAAFAGRRQARLEENERRLNRAIQDSERANQSKTDFLANVSHEMRTPMNGIMGMTELTLDTELTAEQREYLGMVQTSAHNLLDVIDSVLDFSSIEAGKLVLESIDFTVSYTITGTLKPLASVARLKDIELLYDQGEGIPARLRGDPSRLRQIIANLVGNAVKFTEEGEVKVTLEKSRDLDDGVELLFTVSDTGRGIAQEEIEFIFESFQQAEGGTTRSFGGLGLGLSTAAELVEAMGGRIEVDSEPGVGSTFRFTAQFGLGEEPRRIPRLPANAIKGLRALVVDDHETNRRILGAFLERMGAKVTSVSSGPEAIVALDRALGAREPIELLVTDVHMPGMDGFEMANRIRSDGRYDDLVILAVTSAGRPGDGARCEDLDIASYLLKPVTPTELEEALQLSFAEPNEVALGAGLVTRHSLNEGRPSNLHVLLAEDDGVNRKLISHFLEQLGHSVESASDGEEALELLHGSHFDLVLMDLQMPRLDGIGAMERIRNDEELGGRTIPIIALTAHARPGDRHRLLDAGFDDYIAKPVAREQLGDIIRRHMSGLGPKPGA